MKVQDQLGARAPLAQARARVARLVGRPLDDSGRARLPRALRGAARAVRAAGAARPRPRPQAHGASRRARRPDGRDRARAGQGRQRALRPRLLEVHPLLQVRRRVRRAVPEHVRDPRRRPRLRRAHLDRVRGRAARVGVRLLRQLHRRLPDRRAHVPLRARAARGGRLARGRADGDDDCLPLLRRGLQPRAARAGQHDREGDEPRRPRRHARQPLHQGPFRLPARPGARRPAEMRARRGGARRRPLEPDGLGRRRSSTGTDRRRSSTRSPSCGRASTAARSASCARRGRSCRRSTRSSSRTLFSSRARSRRWPRGSRRSRAAARWPSPAASTRRSSCPRSCARRRVVYGPATRRSCR